MNVLWKMRGLDMHFDTNIGKRLSALGKALTAFTGEADIADLSSVADIDDMPDAFEDDGYDVTDSPVIPQLNLSRVQDKEEGLLRPLQAHSLERQLWEQTRRVSELRYPEQIS